MARHYHFVCHNNNNNDELTTKRFTIKLARNLPPYRDHSFPALPDSNRKRAPPSPPSPPSNSSFFQTRPSLQTRPNAVERLIETMSGTVDQKGVEIEMLATSTEAKSKNSIDYLIHKAEVKRAVFTLFQKLDTNASGFLSTKEVTIGFFLAGVQIEAGYLMECIFNVGATEGVMAPRQFYHLLERLGKTKDLTALSNFAEALSNSKRSGHLKRKVTALEALAQDSLEKAYEEVSDQKRKSERLSSSGNPEDSDDMFVENVVWYKKCWNTFMTGKAFYITTVVLWILAHAVLMTAMNGWAIGRAFYYSIQSGLSVGYGSLSEDKVSGTDLWGVCGEGNITEVLAKAYEKFPDGALPTGAGGTLCLGYSEPNKYSEISKLYTVIHLYLGASIISGVLGLFATMAVEQSETWYDEVEANAQADRQTAGQARETSFLKKVLNVYNGPHGSTIRAALALFLWLTIGVLYGVLKEKWTFVSSLYFASAACSTGGLQGPTPDEAGVWFTAAFTIIGVPLYGYTLGQFANGLSESYVKRKKKETMTAAISAAEFNVASHLRKGTNDGNIDLFSFTLLQLYRLRKTDEQEIQEIWNDFEDLDADKNGQFSRSEMQASIAFARLDTDQSYNLNLNEMLELVKCLQAEPCCQYPEIFMIDPDVHYTVKNIKEAMKRYNDDTEIGDDPLILMERGEFMKFWGEEFQKYREKARVTYSHHMVELSVLLKRCEAEGEKGSPGKKEGTPEATTGSK